MIRKKMTGESGISYIVTLITRGNREYIYYEVKDVKDYLSAIVMSVDLKKPLYIIDFINSNDNEIESIREHIVKSGGIIVKKEM